jgi:uncharacterized protein (UPF0276 family)
LELPVKILISSLLMPHSVDGGTTADAGLCATARAAVKRRRFRARRCAPDCRAAAVVDVERLGQDLGMTPFLRRVGALPDLGLGVSTEFGAGRTPGALDVFRLASEHPRWAGFLELGIEVEKGLDDDARRWASLGRPTTYHFLDVNLHDDADFDDEWMAGVRGLLAASRPAWLCGDAGVWHFGARDRGHMLLLPPILVDDSATALARGVARLREATGLEVLPENPPGVAFPGDLHLLDFFARVAARADTGLLLDVAHLAMYQQATGRDALDGFDSFPMERVVEVHVAGGDRRTTPDGFSFVEDSHGTAVLDSTWRIFEHVAARAPNLKAVIFECERNPNVGVEVGFSRIEGILSAGGLR